MVEVGGGEGRCGWRLGRGAAKREVERLEWKEEAVGRGLRWIWPEAGRGSRPEAGEGVEAGGERLWMAATGGRDLDRETLGFAACGRESCGVRGERRKRWVGV